MPMSRMRSEGKIVEMWKMGEIFNLVEWTLMSPIHGSSAMSPHSLLLCRGGGDGICRDELQWLRIHHTPPLYFRQVPNMSSLCYSESGTPLQRPQPSLWEQKTEMTSGLPSPPQASGDLTAPSVTYSRGVPVQRGTWRLLAGSCPSSSPPISAIRGSL